MLKGQSCVGALWVSMCAEDTEKTIVVWFLEDCASRWDFVAGISWTCFSKLSILVSYAFFLI